MYTKKWKCYRKATTLAKPFLREYIQGISLYVHNDWFLYYSIVHTYVNCCTGEYTVAYTKVVYAYNMWYPGHVQCMYTVCTCIYHVCTCTYCVHTCFNQLSQQVFMATTEMQMQDWRIFLSLWRMRMGAVPVQKMVNFFMRGQTLLKWRRPSASGLESQEHSCFDSLHTLQEQCTYLYCDIQVCSSYIICMLMFPKAGCLPLLRNH